MYSQKRIGKEKKTKILKSLKEHAGEWHRYWKLNNEDYRYHVNFINGEQWEENDVQTMRNNGRPVVTINKISPIIKQILGEYRSNVYNIFLRKIGLADDEDNKKMEASVLNNIMPQQPRSQMQQQAGQDNVATDISQLITNTAVIPEDPKLKIYEGLLRQIAYCSDSDEEYYKAGRCAFEGGFGSLKIRSLYDDGLTIRQRYKIEASTDPTRDYWDRTAKHNTKIDGDFCGTLNTLRKSEFEREFPNEPYPTNFTPGDGIVDIFWGDKDFITIGEEYQKKYFKDKAIFNVETGEIYYKSELDEDKLKELERSKDFKETDCQNYKIIFYQFTDNKILNYTECPSKLLPIIFVDGNSYFDKAKQKTQSFIKDAVDAQKSLNFVASDILFWLKLAKKNQWVYPDEVIPEELTSHWNQTENPSLGLPYNGEEAARLGLKPEMTPPPKMPTDLIEQYTRLTNDIKEAMGRYDANIGKASNETSGIAIANRAMVGAATIDVYRENLRVAISTIGKVIIKGMPNIYDDERVVTISNRDGTTEEVSINKRVFNAKNMKWELNVDMRSMGDWDIEVVAGASHALQKQQDIDNIETLIKLDPHGQAYPLLAPILAEQLDSPNAKQIASRLAFNVPPNVLAAEQGKKFAPPPSPQQELFKGKIEEQNIKNQTSIQKTKIDIMNAQSTRMTAQSNVMKAQAAIADIAAKEGIEPQKLMVELIRAEIDAQHKEKSLIREMMNEAQGGTQPEEQQQPQYIG